MEEYKIVLKQYYDRWSYSVPIIGINVSLADFSFFGPLSLFIFSFYFVSCSRNSVLQLSNLNQKTNLTAEEQERARILITSEVVLNTSGKQLSLDAGISRVAAKGSFQRTNVYQVLLFMPSVASFSALGSDMYYSYLQKTFECKDWANMGKLGRFECSFLASKIGWKAKGMIVGYDVMGVLLCLVILAYCISALAYSRKSESLSREVTLRGQPFG